MGQGVLGLLALPLLRAAGAIPIIAVDPVAEKRAKALSAGADAALDPFAEDFADTAREITGGGARVGIEVTGFGAGLDGILDCMGRFGRVALLGCTRNKEFSIDYYRKVHAPGITLVGAHTMARPGQESHPRLVDPGGRYSHRAAPDPGRAHPPFQPGKTKSIPPPRRPPFTPDWRWKKRSRWCNLIGGISNEQNPNRADRHQPIQPR